MARIIHATNGVSGIAASFLPHDIRAGSLRDLAHVPASQILGVAKSAVAKAAGHTKSTLTSGTTDRYIGGISQDLNQLKATHPYNDLSAPITGAPVRKKARVSPKEIDARISDFDDKENRSIRIKVARTIKRENEAIRLREAAERIQPDHLPPVLPSPNIALKPLPQTHQTPFQLNRIMPASVYDTSDYNMEMIPGLDQDVGMVPESAYGMGPTERDFDETNETLHLTNQDQYNVDMGLGIFEESPTTSEQNTILDDAVNEMLLDNALDDALDSDITPTGDHQHQPASLTPPFVDPLH